MGKIIKQLASKLNEKSWYFTMIDGVFVNVQ